MLAFNPMFPEATEEQKWDQFRLYRLEQMSLSDWTRTDDCQLSQEVVEAVFEYRQLLRDAPNLYSRVEDVPFPGYMVMKDYKIIYIPFLYKVNPIRTNHEE